MNHKRRLKKYLLPAAFVNLCSDVRTKNEVLLSVQLKQKRKGGKKTPAIASTLLKMMSIFGASGENIQYGQVIQRQMMQPNSVCINTGGGGITAKTIRRTKAFS